MQISRIKKNHILYGLYNTALVTIPDMAIMNSITDWNSFNSSGLNWAYLAAFNGLKLLPPILLYLKDRSKHEFANYVEIYAWTLPFQDLFYYTVKSIQSVFQGPFINPLSPFEGQDWIKSYNYTFPWGNEQVAQYFGRSFALAGIYSLIKRNCLNSREILYNFVKKPFNLIKKNI